jgi:glycosyltransferase involved in cell wall biosynthesis
MRVMHIITRMIVGGAQENTLFNCLDLDRMYGDQVKLITGPSQGAEGALLQQSDTSGLSVDVHPSLIRAIHPIHDAGALGAIKQSIREWKPDVVHTHSAKGGLLGRAAAWKLRVPCVVHTVHGAPFHDYQNALSRWFFIRCERWAAKRCHRMISVADAMTELMVRARVAPLEKFTTIYSGMDVEPFLNAALSRTQMRAQLGFNDSDVVIGKIARLFHLKGHEYVIKAAEAVCRAHPNARFLMVGDGILKEPFQKKIESLGLTKHFVFSGLVPPHQVPQYVGAMDVLVHASLREGLARALPQGLIAGKPVISFDIDGAREVVINGVTGCLLTPQDVPGLAQAMIQLANDPDLRERLGKTGQQRFTEQFRHETMTRRIRDLYASILSRSI